MKGKQGGTSSVGGRLCAVVLVLLPIAFLVGHLLSRGVVWNHSTGETFSPLTNWISDYAYRSPAWPWFIACMVAFAVVLGLLSWRIFRTGTQSSVVVWLVSLLLGYGALKLVEVAVFPVKPPEVTVEELQGRLDRSVWEQVRDEVVDTYYGIRGRATGEARSASEVIRAFEGNTAHLTGIRGGLFAVLGAMAFGVLLPFGARWRVVSSLLWVGAMLAIANLRGTDYGLYQRLAYWVQAPGAWLTTSTPNSTAMSP